ncbi:hypothetical protein AHF37_06200 [Paragonimus kellicotti]|nr:hypothetical protein AHF37_06200 [Paragonimus kellicotti]
MSVRSCSRKVIYPSKHKPVFHVYLQSVWWINILPTEVCFVRVFIGSHGSEFGRQSEGFSLYSFTVVCVSFRLPCSIRFGYNSWRQGWDGFITDPRLEYLFALHIVISVDGGIIDFTTNARDAFRSITGQIAVTSD